MGGAGAQLVAHSANADGDWHLLVDHLRGTADRAAEFGSAFASGDIARLAGLVHDIGKADPEWQMYLRTVAAGAPHSLVDHKYAGMYLARDAGLGDLLAPVIAGHHGGMPWVQDLQPRLSDGPTSGQAQALTAAPDLGIEAEDLRSSVPAFALAKRGDEACFRSTELWSRMIFSALVDADHLDTEAHFRPDRAAERARVPESISALRERFDRSVDNAVSSRAGDPIADARIAMRREVDSQAGAQRGWFELTAPTGSGKTLSGLSFALRHAEAHQMRRIVTAVPFISVTEQVAAVYREVLDRPGSSVVVEHHSALGDSADGGQVGEELAARLATENWDAPVIVTTTVQLLESLFDNRPSRCRKLHRLAGSVIVLDEVQAIPWRILEPTLEVLRSLVHDYGASILLTTATQPPLHLISTVKDTPRTKLITGRAADSFDRVVARPIPEPVALDDLPDVIMAVDPSGSGQCLTVVNSVADARQLARSMIGVEGVHHLSTRLCMAHRRDVMRQMHHDLALNRPCLLVSTQLIEAGVDVDFPAAIRATAPLPSMVQVAGRVNRHGLREQGVLTVVEVADGRMPPEEYALGAQLTRDLMRDGHDLLAPETLASYYERFLDYARDKLDHFEVQSVRATRNYPEVARRYRVIVDDSIGVLVPYGDFDPVEAEVPTDPGARRGWARRVQPFIVSLREREFQRSVTAGTVVPMGPGVWRWAGAYDPLVGLVTDSTMEGSIW